MRWFTVLCMSEILSASFRRLAWFNLLAQSAEQLSLAAVPIVAVLLLQAGPGEIGLLASIQSLPFLLLSMPLGLLADRTSRTRLMALAETLRALALLLLLALIVTGNVSIAALAIIGFVAAVGTVAFIVVSTGVRPLGAALGGVVGVSFPVSVSLWCVVLGFGLQAIIISASKIRTLKRTPNPLPD